MLHNCIHMATVGIKGLNYVLGRSESLSTEVETHQFTAYSMSCNNALQKLKHNSKSN